LHKIFCEFFFQKTFIKQAASNRPLQVLGAHIAESSINLAGTLIVSIVDDLSINKKLG